MQQLAILLHACLAAFASASVIQDHHNIQNNDQEHKKIILENQLYGEKYKAHGTVIAPIQTHNHQHPIITGPSNYGVIEQKNDYVSVVVPNSRGKVLSPLSNHRSVTKAVGYTGSTLRSIHHVSGFTTPTILHHSGIQGNKEKNLKGQLRSVVKTDNNDHGAALHKTAVSRVDHGASIHLPASTYSTKNPIKDETHLSRLSNHGTILGSLANDEAHKTSFSYKSTITHKNPIHKTSHGTVSGPLSNHGPVTRTSDRTASTLRAINHVSGFTTPTIPHHFGIQRNKEENLKNQLRRVVKPDHHVHGAALDKSAAGKIDHSASVDLPASRSSIKNPINYESYLTRPSNYGTVADSLAKNAARKGSSSYKSTKTHENPLHTTSHSTQKIYPVNVAHNTPTTHSAPIIHTHGSVPKLAHSTTRSVVHVQDDHHHHHHHCHHHC